MNDFILVNLVEFSAITSISSFVSIDLIFESGIVFDKAFNSGIVHI